MITSHRIGPGFHYDRKVQSLNTGHWTDLPFAVHAVAATARSRRGMMWSNEPLTRQLAHGRVFTLLYYPSLVYNRLIRTLE